jgi:hypothetical protein
MLITVIINLLFLLLGVGIGVAAMALVRMSEPHQDFADATTQHQLILAAFDLALASKQVITDCFAPLPVDMTADEKKAVFALDRANRAFALARESYEGRCPIIPVKPKPFNPIAEELVLGKGEWEKILKKLDGKKGGK